MLNNGANFWESADERALSSAGGFGFQQLIKSGLVSRIQLKPVLNFQRIHRGFADGEVAGGLVPANGVFCVGEPDDKVFGGLQFFVGVVLGEPHTGPANNHALALAAGRVGQVRSAQFKAVFGGVVLAVHYVAGGGDFHSGLTGNKDGVRAVPVFQFTAVGVVAFVVHFFPPVQDCFGGVTVKVGFGGAAFAAIGVISQFGAHIGHPLLKEPTVQRPGNAVLGRAAGNDGVADIQHLFKGFGGRFRVQSGSAEDVFVIIQNGV